MVKPKYPISLVESQIDNWIYNERYRAILRDSLYGRGSFEKLSEKYDLSVTQIKNIVMECKDVVFDKCEEELQRREETARKAEMPLLVLIYPKTDFNMA